MHRILLGMAFANYLLVAVTMLLGLLSEPPADLARPGNEAFAMHFLMGIGTSLFTMLVHCIVFTYFLGTTRWVKETAGAYSLGQDYIVRSRACRSRAMAAAMVSILAVVLVVASGAGAHTLAWPKWVHQVVPAATYLFMLYAYRVQYEAVEQHVELTDRVMDAVNAIRRTHGLAVE